MPESPLRREKIWDPVSRLWHWVLVVVVCVGWSFGRFMSFSTIEWHFYCGYTVIGLITFRIIWGLVGPEPVRLRALIPRPRAFIQYLKHIARRMPSGTPGHNPVGALSVILMLLLLSAQATSGLFIESDDFFESAPLSYLVSDAVTNRLTWWHKTLADAILIVVALHVAAIFFYWIWKRENLIKPMITGWKWVRDETKDNAKT